MEKRRPFHSADMTSYLLIAAILTWTAHQGVSGDQTACSGLTRCYTNWIRAIYPSHNSNLPNQQLQASAVQGYGLKKKIKHKKAPDAIIKDTEAISDGVRSRPSSLHRRHHRLLLDSHHSGQPPLYYLKRRKLQETAIKSRRRSILQARARAVQAASKTLNNATVGDHFTPSAAETPRRRFKPSRSRTTVRPGVAAGRDGTPVGVEDIRNQLELLSKHGFSDVGSESVSKSATSIWSRSDDRDYRANKLRKRRKLMALRQEGKHNRFYTNLSTAKREQILEETSRSANRIVKTVPERKARNDQRRKLSQIKFPSEKFTTKKKIPDVKDNRLDQVEFPVKKAVVVKKKLVKSAVATNISSAVDPSTKGMPGVDYPIYSTIPDTPFRCSSQRYWGMYADTDTQCQVWHYCDRDGSRHSFLCPNGTVFSQVTFICDWWYNVDCNTASQLYVTNEALSLLPAPPDRTFPEDFNGPIVDWYIFQRHQEKAYRKNKFLKLISEGVKQKSIRFLDTHDLPPWFSDRDRKLYTKLKELERMSKRHMRKQKHQPVKKALNTYSPRLR